jgi:type VI secretion system protein ImpA
MYSAQELLQPVNDTHPAGADLTFSPELDAIAQARKFDDPSLDQGEWVTELKEADWPLVVDRCAHLLKNTSKDLRLAVWLTEAGARVHQLRGLGEGYLLLAGLCDQYWDQGLYPQAGNGDNDQRIGNLGWILARTPALVREIGLTENGDYSTLDFEQARKRAASNDDALQNRAPKLADIEAAKRNNSAQFAASFRADAQFCVEALEQLERVADAKLGNDSPGFSSARDAVKAMLHAMPAPANAVSGSGGTQPAAPGHPVVLPGMPMPESGNEYVQAPTAPGAIANRAQAVALLRAVAEFFRRTEPHSPSSYYADKAAAAGEQDLHTWLRTVVKDQASLAHIEELLGVQPQN